MTQHDLIVIGAGPGGYVAAIRAAQLGLNVGCIEKEPALGGTCLRVGCIPSKALLESSERYEAARHELAPHGINVAGVSLDLAALLKRKDQIVGMTTKGIDGLFKKNKITRYQGTGRFLSDGHVAVESDAGTEEISAPHVLIATGSKVQMLPGVQLDGAYVGTSSEALTYSTVPSRLAVIGAGAIGLELGSVWRRLGAEVTVFEYLDRILPGMDAELAAEAQKVFTKQGLKFHLKSRVTGARREGDECLVEVAGLEPQRFDRVLLAVGRVPNFDGLDLAAIGLAPNQRGRLEVDESFRTSRAGVYAIGDCIAGPMLAHKAEDEGMACVEKIATGYGHVNYDAIPNIVYTEPEIASVGQTEEQLQASGIPYRKGAFPYQANARARVLGHTAGRVKILAHAETDRILGIHILGTRAGDLIAEGVVAMEFCASSEDLARTTHAHPTLSEIVREAALAVDGRAIHI
ncbi:MAG: dihydrolipoyl dehydrogenase [Planctomycetaceae bacterium]|nr:dihydrolipoyl dehydrogenase [Planctomycetaceae bacterium]